MASVARLTKLPFVDIPGWVALPRALLGPGQVRGEYQGVDGEEEGYRHEIAAVELDDFSGCRAPLRRRQGHTKSFDQAVQFRVGVAVPGVSAPLVFRARNIGGSHAVEAALPVVGRRHLDPRIRGFQLSVLGLGSRHYQLREVESGLSPPTCHRGQDLDVGSGRTRSDLRGESRPAGAKIGTI